MAITGRYIYIDNLSPVVNVSDAGSVTVVIGKLKEDK